MSLLDRVLLEVLVQTRYDSCVIEKTTRKRCVARIPCSATLSEELLHGGFDCRIVV